MRPHKYMSNLLGGEVEIIGCSTRDLRGSKPPLPAACLPPLVMSELTRASPIRGALKRAYSFKNRPTRSTTSELFRPRRYIKHVFMVWNYVFAHTKTHVYSGSRIRKMLPSRPLRIKAQKAGNVALLSAKSQGIYLQKDRCYFKKSFRSPPPPL